MLLLILTCIFYTNNLFSCELFISAQTLSSQVVNFFTIQPGLVLGKTIISHSPFLSLSILDNRSCSFHFSAGFFCCAIMISNIS